MSNSMSNSNSNPIVIMLYGMKRSGKDTVADYLSNYNYTKLSIAEPLKEVCKYLFDFTDDQVNGDLKEIIDDKYGVSPRKMMQFFGTEIMQFKMQEICPTIGREFWINKLIATINKKRITEANTKFVISDMRFKHEYDAIKNEFHDKCISIMIVNERLPEVDQHISETEWKHITPNYVVYNNSGKKELYDNIDKIMTTIK